MPNKSDESEAAADDSFSLRPHYLHELPLEDEERLGKLFANLDKNGNGKIDIHDLSDELKKHGHGVHHQYAEVGLI